MSDRDTDGRRRFAQRLRSFGAAAVAGLLFGTLLIAAVILLHRLPDQNASESGIAEWLTSRGSRDSMVAALQLTTWSVIAFLSADLVLTGISALRPRARGAGVRSRRRTRSPSLGNSGAEEQVESMVPSTPADATAALTDWPGR